jgi:hypothetical protein
MTPKPKPAAKPAPSTGASDLEEQLAAAIERADAAEARATELEAASAESAGEASRLQEQSRVDADQINAAEARADAAEKRAGELEAQLADAGQLASSGSELEIRELRGTFAIYRGDELLTRTPDLDVAEAFVQRHTSTKEG